MSQDDKEPTPDELYAQVESLYPSDVEPLSDTWGQENLGKYKPMAWDSAADFLMWYDKNFQSERVTLNPWQIETLDFLSASHPTQEYPLCLNICAVNGSGKDSYVIAPWAIFFCACKVRSRFIITSSSYKQLFYQTESYIRHYCNAINERLGYKFFIIKKQHIVCKETGSEIVLFVTDEEGNVEGYHPFPDAPDSEMCILTNESKSVSDKTFNALRRCTGFNYWIEVSSPGQKEGHFYKRCCTAIVFPAEYDRNRVYMRRVTAYDCKHISKTQIELARLELEDWLFRSMFLAEFTSELDEVVITIEKLEALRSANVVWNGDIVDMAGGLDLSLGGDETVLSTRRGNKISYMDIWNIKDTNVLEATIDEKLRDRGYVKGSTPIYTDVGGLGKPIYQHLQALGWNLVPILNNRAAMAKHLYLNGGTEDWYHLKSLVVRKCIILPDDSKLSVQITSRHYEYKDNSKIKLESKQEARAQGRPSPDRADSVVLAFIGYTAPELSSINDYRKMLSEKGPINQLKRVTQVELVDAMEQNKFGVFAGQMKEMDEQKHMARNLHGQEALIDLMLKDLNNGTGNN